MPGSDKDKAAREAAKRGESEAPGLGPDGELNIVEEGSPRKPPRIVEVPSGD